MWCINNCENSSAGRAQPCQGWGRGFEPRFSLQISLVLFLYEWGFNSEQKHHVLDKTNIMNEKTKDFKPFICIDSVGIFPFKDSSILLINHTKSTQQTDHNGKTISELIKEKKVSSWQIARNSFPGDVRRVDPPELLTFWNEKKLSGHFQQKGET